MMSQCIERLSLSEITIIALMGLVYLNMFLVDMRILYSIIFARELCNGMMLEGCDNNLHLKNLCALSILYDVYFIC